MRIFLILLIGMFVLSSLPLLPFGGVGADTSSRENPLPSIAITHPSNEATVKGTITISGTASDNTNVTLVQLIILEEHYNATDTSGNNTWFTWNITLNTTEFEDGWLNIGALAKDDQEGLSDTSIKVLINNAPPDETKPNVWIGSPANNTVLSGTGRIAGHATDNKKVHSVALDVGHKEFNAVDTSGNSTWYKWVLEFDTTQFDNGKYKVTVWAWDTSENNDTEVIWIYINNTVEKENHWPYVEITHPANEATVSGIITITGKAWDPDGNVTSVQVHIAPDTYGYKFNATDISGNGTWYYWELKFNTSTVADGEWRVVAISKDDGGKLGDHGIWIIVKNTKENLAPHVKITHPANEATVSGVIVIKGTASDDNKVVKVRVRIFEVWYNATDTSGNSTWTTWKLEFNTSILKDGEYKVTAVAYDDKEKLADIGIWIIVKNHKENLAPHIEITHPKNEATVSGVIKITGKAWDKDGSILIVKVRIGEHTFNATDTSGNGSWYTWSFELNTTKYDNGERKIGAIAWDNKEKAEDTSIWIIIKNPVKEEKPNKAPYVFIDHPKHHAYVKDVIKISGRAWDVDGKVTKVKVRIFEVWYEAKDTSGNSSWYTWSLEFNTTVLKNGWHKITAAAYDGHAWGDDYIYVYINNTVHENKCPELSILHPSMDSEVSGNVVFSGKASDDKGIEYIKVKIGDHKFNATDTSTDDSFSTWKYIWNTSGYENGAYRIVVLVYDGKCLKEGVVEVTLNNTSKENSSNSSNSSNSPDSDSETDSSPDNKSDNKDDEKSSSPLPGFDGPTTLIAAAVAIVVVSFFRSSIGRSRTG